MRSVAVLQRLAKHSPCAASATPSIRKRLVSGDAIRWSSQCKFALKYFGGQSKFDLTAGSPVYFRSQLSSYDFREGYSCLGFWVGPIGGSHTRKYRPCPLLLSNQTLFLSQPASNRVWLSSRGVISSTLAISSIDQCRCFAAGGSAANQASCLARRFSASVGAVCSARCCFAPCFRSMDM